MSALRTFFSMSLLCNPERLLPQGTEQIEPALQGAGCARAFFIIRGRNFASLSPLLPGIGPFYDSPASAAVTLFIPISSLLRKSTDDEK